MEKKTWKGRWKLSKESGIVFGTMLVLFLVLVLDDYLLPAYQSLSDFWVHVGIIVTLIYLIVRWKHIK